MRRGRFDRADLGATSFAAGAARINADFPLEVDPLRKVPPP
jgi:hypothetical protein